MAAIAMLVGDAVPLAVRQHNPKGGASRARYEGYKSATNAKVFIALGGSKGDLQNDLIKGHIQLLGPDGEPIEWHTHEHVVAVAVTGPAAGRKAAAAARASPPRARTPEPRARTPEPAPEPADAAAREPPAAEPDGPAAHSLLCGASLALAEKAGSLP